MARRQYILHVLILGAILFSGCAININHTQRIADSLNSSDLYSSFGTEPVNLLPYSKCDVPLAINIVNDEQRENGILIYNSIVGPQGLFIRPKELTDHIVKYMIDALEKSNVKKDQSSKKQIKVSLKRVNWIDKFTIGALVEIQTEIPEIKFTNMYSVEEHSMIPEQATAYAIHVLTWKVINDPVVKGYILCANTSPSEKSPVKESALNILKRRYASGEITKEQFEQMKKDIQ